MMQDIVLKVDVPEAAKQKDIKQLRRVLNTRAERWARGVANRYGSAGIVKAVPKCADCKKFTPYPGETTPDGVQMGGCGEWCTNVQSDWGCDGGAFQPKEER